jgi:hypothetical protein
VEESMKYIVNTYHFETYCEVIVTFDGENHQFKAAQMITALRLALAYIVEKERQEGRA